MHIKIRNAKLKSHLQLQRAKQWCQTALASMRTLKTGLIDTSGPVNCISAWYVNLTAMCEAKLTFKLTCQSLSIVFIDAVDTILLGRYRDLMFSFCNKFLVRLHGEYNPNLALWKHHVNLLLQSFRSVSSDLHQC